MEFGGSSPTCPIQDDNLLGFTTGCYTTSQFRGSFYSQRSSMERLNADGPSITATGAGTGTILFSWSKGSQDQGRYNLICDGSYTNSAGGANGLGIAVQTALAAAPFGASTGVYTGTTVAGAYVTNNNTTATPIFTGGSPIGGGVPLPFHINTWVDVSAFGTQVNVIFYSNGGGTTVIQKGSFCTLSGV